MEMFAAFGKHACGRELAASLLSVRPPNGQAVGRSVTRHLAALPMRGTFRDGVQDASGPRKGLRPSLL